MKTIYYETYVKIKKTVNFNDAIAEWLKNLQPLGNSDKGLTLHVEIFEETRRPKK
jgi:hypothetical protein